MHVAARFSRIFIEHCLFCAILKQKKNCAVYREGAKVSSQIEQKIMT